jgi:sulfur relay protein TusB/DsrH
MPTLFILHKAPSSNHEIEQALELAKSGDGLVFLQDSVLALRSDMGLGKVQKAQRNGVSVFALVYDMKARGVPEISGIRAIDYDDLIELVLQHQRTFS